MATFPNKVFFIDCMDVLNGLPSLEDNSIDMCLTAPPFNIGYKGKNLAPSIEYSDNNENYIEWCILWFKEIFRICKMSVIECGTMNLNMWIKDIMSPIGILYHQSYGTNVGDKVTNLTTLNPYLIYGKLNKRFKVNPLKSQNHKDKFRGTMNHPCPFNSRLISDILERQNPTSVIDPFSGSGTVGFCCKQLGIDFIGYEKDERYRNDIKKRLSQRGVLDY